MSKDQATKIIAHAVMELAEAKPLTERARLFRALSLLLPPAEKFEAERTAWTYEEAERQQLKFEAMVSVPREGDGNGQ
jgi:hypothetical protein